MTGQLDPDAIIRKLDDLEALGMGQDAFWVKRLVNELRRVYKAGGEAQTQLREENQSLKKRLKELKKDADRLKTYIEKGEKTFEHNLNALQQFRDGIRIAELMHAHEDMPAILDKVRARFNLDAVGLVLEEEEYGRFLPDSILTAPRSVLALAAKNIEQAIGEKDRRKRHAFMGDIKLIERPEFFFGKAFLAKRKAALIGSCFIYPLRDKFSPDKLIGVISFFDVKPGRYSLEKDSDYVEHFCDILGYAVVDVTDRKKAELLREDVDRMTRHDLKSPLTAILTLPQLFKRDGNLTERQEDMLNLVQSAGYRMLHMINQSLDLYKMESGTYELNPSPVDMLPILDNIAAEFRGLIEAKELELAVAVCGEKRREGDAFVVRGEEMLCYTMLSNLIRNALEASPEGKTVEVALEEGGGSARVSVRNLGAVPKDIRKQFFGKYVTAGKRDGTGLGTYGARLMAEIMGGKISMRTSEKEGTAVTVSLLVPSSHYGRKR